MKSIHTFGNAWRIRPRAALYPLNLQEALARGAYRGALQALTELTPDAVIDAMIQSDPRTRDSIWQGVSLSFGCLADPRVLDAVSPGPDEVFDPEQFLRSNGTLTQLSRKWFNADVTK